MDKDPYQILGVSPLSTRDEIHKAFRALATKYHPDKNLNDSENASIKFKEINAAFEIIGDDNKRRQYDLYREGSFSSFTFKSRNSVDSIFDNMFSQFFGNQRQGGSRTRVKISFEESYFGCIKNVDVEKNEFCDGCKGTGSSSWEPCQKCFGKGFISFSKGSFAARSSCVVCEGRGSIPKEKCSSCLGIGCKTSEKIKVEVKIPSGIENGSQIRIPGEKSADDIFVYVVVEKNSKFERHGHSILHRLSVSYSKLVLGGSEELDFFGSKLSVKIPPRTNPGARIKIKGKGMSSLQNPNARGDLLIELLLYIPKELTKEHESLLSKIMKIESRD